MTGTGGALIHAPLAFRVSNGGAGARDPFIVCPKCEAPAFIRRSERQTEKVKHLTCHCTNSACGHIFKMELVFVHTLVPGNIDRPDLDLPVCPRDQLHHVMPPPRASADDGQITMFDSG